MKPIIATTMVSLVAAGAMISLAPGMAKAQTTTTTVTKSTTIAPTEEPRIREYVLKEHRHSIAPPPGFALAPGAVLPESVEVYPFPTGVPWHNYRYAVINGETVLIDPANRHVVTVIR